MTQYALSSGRKQGAPLGAAEFCSVQLASGESFSAAAGQTLLEAARVAGLVLEHSCSTGRCGSCRGRLRHGRPVVLKEPSALSAQELQDGWILTCAHGAGTDLALDVAALPVGAAGAPVTVPARLAGLSRLADDVLQVTLRFPPSAQLRCLPGQHVEVRSPDGVWRRYSAANATEPGAPMELHVRRVEGGLFSSYWFERARPDDLLRVRGPLGTFCLRPWAGRALVFLATGTGVAPFLAMLTQLDRLAPEARPLGTTLYWGGRSPADLYLDIRQLAAGRQDWLRVVPVLSRGDGTWAGARGHVQDVLLSERANLFDTVVYACGSARMVASARHRLAACGLPPGDFHSDAFVSSG